jgi:polygalacturonase
MMRLIILSIFVFTSLLNVSGGSAVYYPSNYGAKADGKTLDTKAIQKAIDDCHINGGGKVYLHNGVFRTGTLILKSNVNLYIETGATLRASDDLDDFPSMPSLHPSYSGTYVTNKMVIYAENASNISITGRGTIDGNGNHWVGGPYGFPSFSQRPRIIHFRGCENILVRDITLYNSASWVQSYQSCKNMVIDGITVDSRENKDIEKERYADVPGRNTDGLDLVDCQNVRISNCYINSGDDAICLKSFSPDEGCRDITISNCVVSSNASGIKIGTETAGTFEDITIRNCVVHDTRVDAISVISVDGARVERINISDITVRNIKGSAIFIRIGNRNRPYRENSVINTPHLRDIRIGNIQGTRISAENGCIIAGIENFPVENVVLQNINLDFEGGKKVEDSYREIPDNETAYPNGKIFGVLPAYGLYIRHAKGVILENIRFGLITEDQRPAILIDNTEQLDINDLRAAGSPNSPELIRLINSRDIMIRESQPLTQIPLFLSVYGEKSSGIILQNNILKKAAQKVNLAAEAMREIITEKGNIY